MSSKSVMKRQKYKKDLELHQQPCYSSSRLTIISVIFFVGLTDLIIPTLSSAALHQQMNLKRTTVSTKEHHEENPSTNCLTKRNEILHRQTQNRNQDSLRQLSQIDRSNSTPLHSIAGIQRLQPNNEHQVSSQQKQKQKQTQTQTQTTTPQPQTDQHLMNSLDNEHVPRCNHHGGYEPVQCHRIGYCWCVNKYGQAIKNTAVSGEKPICDPRMYESESSDWTVVAGVSPQRMDQFLKNVSNFDSNTPKGHINFDAPENTTDPYDSSTIADPSSQLGNQSEQNARSPAINRRPIMPLIPNDCRRSRINALERANRYVNDSIWIPDCVPKTEHLYAEKQCHRSKVCWCVDQSTGLPLRTGDQLTVRSSTNNCTELKRLIEMFTAPKPQATFYSGSSEHCDADKRSEFIITLSSQFRQQISEYVRQNPSSLINLPQGISSTDPNAVSDAQISRWKFSIMDRDSDGKLGDREWSKFKNNFKLVERVDELDNPLKQQKSPYSSLIPLLFLRYQRKCWRDFLDFCGGKDLLIDESVSLSKWLSCTEVPLVSNIDGEHPNNHQHKTIPSSLENTYAHSREAAIMRSKNKNPFLQILKPD